MMTDGQITLLYPLSFIAKRPVFLVLRLEGE